MDKNQVRIHFFKIMLAVLCCSTWVFTSFVLATRPLSEPDGDALSKNQVSANAFASLVRLPASLPLQIPEALPGVFAPIRVHDPIRMEIAKIPCWDLRDEAVVETSARWIRLQGKACGLSLNSDTLSVRNKTNGHVATVFSQPNAELTTDFIPMQSGQNEIEVSFVTADGNQIQHQFIFQRD